MARRRPRIVTSDIKRQTRGFAESPFVIFENLRARKMSHDFLIRGSGCASFAHYAFRETVPTAPFMPALPRAARAKPPGHLQSTPPSRASEFRSSQLHNNPAA